MHKDLNSFKVGNAEIMLEWKKLGLEGPVLLANKQNASILRNLLDPAVPRNDALRRRQRLTEEQFAAFEASMRGGVKACVLVGILGSLCRSLEFWVWFFQTA